jgi:hypothetical protein
VRQNAVSSSDSFFSNNNYKSYHNSYPKRDFLFKMKFFNKESLSKKKTLLAPDGGSPFIFTPVFLDTIVVYKYEYEYEDIILFA